jgi:hypothetical protein
MQWNAALRRLTNGGGVKARRVRSFIDPVTTSLLLVVLTLIFPLRQNMAETHTPPPKRDINAVLASHDKELLTIPDVVGVYIGTLGDGRTPCLRVMLAHKNPESERKIPRMIEGYSVVTEVTGEARALGTP